MKKQNGTDKHPIQLANGVVNLTSKEGSLYKRALLCRTGTFDGMYGRITVSRELLERLANRYNKQRSKPANEHDFAPVQKDHSRSVDDNKGRLMADLVVDDWVNPETDVTEAGLYGTLRIDRDQDKVDSGQYSQLSISFDEEGETEIYEVSFVGVEAARRSQVLEQGDKNMSVELQKQLEAANAKHQALAAKLASQKLSRKEVVLAMTNTLALSLTSLSGFETTVKEVSLQMRQVALTSQLRGYIREGKMSKAEFDAIKVKELAALDPAAAKMVLASYEGRKPSTDIIQHGQTGAQPVSLDNMPAAELRLMMEAQKSGKPYTPKALAAGEGDSDEKKAAAAAGGEGGKEKEGDSETKFSDIEETLKKLNECMPAVAKLREHMKSMDEAIGKMKGSDEDEAA